MERDTYEMTPPTRFLYYALRLAKYIPPTVCQNNDMAKACHNTLHYQEHARFDPGALPLRDGARQPDRASQPACLDVCCNGKAKEALALIGRSCGSAGGNDRPAQHGC